jgi:hypothetical protein
MKRIRRLSIEVERREITLYATDASWSGTAAEASPPANANPAGLEMSLPSEELVAALRDGRAHLHRSADGHITVCHRKDCDQ